MFLLSIFLREYEGKNALQVGGHFRPPIPINRDDGQMATVTWNEGSSFHFGAQQHHALLIVRLVVAISSEAF
jgi:hypothetical protein